MGIHKGALELHLGRDPHADLECMAEGGWLDAVVMPVRDCRNHA